MNVPQIGKNELDHGKGGEVNQATLIQTLIVCASKTNNYKRNLSQPKYVPQNIKVIASARDKLKGNTSPFLYGNQAHNCD